MDAKLPARERLEYLDSLRGLAALSVVFSHFFLGYEFPASVRYAFTSSPLHIFWDGFAAVSLFFVLSGFVLARKFLLARESPLRSFLPFCAARTIRIWLPFLATLGLSLALQLALPKEDAYYTMESPWLRAFWGVVQTPLWLAKQALLILHFPGDRLIPQDWTLTQEIDLSYLLPFFAWAVMKSSLLFTGAILVGIKFLKLPVLTFHFALGVLLAKHETGLRGWARGSRSRRVGLLLVGLFLYTFRFTLPEYSPGLIAEQRIWYVTGLGSALLLLLAMSSQRLQAQLNRPALLWLGAISFALYLTHLAPLIAMVPRMVHWLQAGAGVPAEWAPWAVLPVYLVLALALAHAFTRLVDVPCVKWSRALFRTLSRESGAAGRAEPAAPAAADRLAPAK